MSVGNGKTAQERTTETALSRRRLVGLSAATLLAGSVAGSGAVSLGGPRRAEAAASAAGRLDRILRSGKLRAGQFLSYKPYGFKDPNGNPDGFDVELTKMLAADMGVQPEFVDNTWDGIIPALLADKFDIVTANMALTTKRALTIQFAHPHSFTATGFIFRSTDARRFSSLSTFNLPAVTVSILIQDASHATLARFFPRAKVRDFNSAQEAILAVQTNKVDCSAAELSFLTEYAKEHPGLTVKAVTYPGSTNPAAMAFAPGPDNDHFRFFLDTWVQFYFWTGKYEALWKKWLPTSPLPKIEKFMAPV
jgi:polar amino acid transport system substrate-binding protein